MKEFSDLFSSMFNLSLLFFIISLVLGIIIPVCIGIFVYQDAKRRRMNALMWAIVTFLTPGFVGLIIYLIIRSEHIVNQCANCGYPVQDDFVRCPQCGSSLKNQCSTCGYPIEPTWNICPSCGNAISIQQNTAYTNVTIEKDRGTWKLLIVIFAVPLILCIVLIISMVSIFRKSTNWMEEQYSDFLNAPNSGFEWYWEEVPMDQIPIDQLEGDYEDLKEFFDNNYFEK